MFMFKTPQKSYKQRIQKFAYRTFACLFSLPLKGRASSQNLGKIWWMHWGRNGTASGALAAGAAQNWNGTASGALGAGAALNWNHKVKHKIYIAYNIKTKKWKQLI
jgi:hypothetical protein